MAIHPLHKVEIQAPTNDWSLTWKLVRLEGLGSELTGFYCKLIHGLLVTKKRKHQLNPLLSPTWSSWRRLQACPSGLLLQWWGWVIPTSSCSESPSSCQSWTPTSTVTWSAPRRGWTLCSHSDLHMFDGNVDEEAQQAENQTVWHPSNLRGSMSSPQRNCI